MAAAPELLELAAIAGCPEVLSAVGIDMTASQRAEAAMAITSKVLETGSVASVGVREPINGRVSAAQFAAIAD